MLRYLTYQQLEFYPALKASMFRDRALQFKERLKWEVNVDSFGFEKDQYDDHQAVYAIWQKPDGTHGASMRMRPTTSRTMINDVFHSVIGFKVVDYRVWESTRFCVSPNETVHSRKLSASIMLAGLEFGIQYNLSSAVAIFDRNVRCIYRSIGWSPEILGTQFHEGDKVYAGRWHFPRNLRNKLCKKAGVSVGESTAWINADLGLQSTDLPRVA